jgi:membrane protease subunit (stomatin/prohibitin family)
MGVDQYLAAKTEFERLDKEVAAIASLLMTVAAALRNDPGRFIFTNCSVGLPAEASLGGGISVDSNGWQTPQQIQELLAKWHQAKSAMQQAWSSVPSEHRSSLVPPPALHEGRHGR